MGRYYTGDIEGKFWFGVQSSDAPSRFGGDMWEPTTVTFYFETGHLGRIRDELLNIKKTLGQKTIEKIDKFFKENETYNEEMLAKYLKKTKKQVGQILVDYADLKLGQKIEKCVAETGECQMECEY